MTARLLHVASIGLLAAMTLQAEPIDDFLAEAEKFSAVLRQANDALRNIRDTATADAAVEAVENMQRARTAMDARCKALRKQGWSIARLEDEAGLSKILRNMPGGIYNELARQELDTGCHGSTRLFLALTGRQKEFTEAQAAAPLDEQDKATLETMRHGLELIRLMTANNPGISNQQALPLLREDIAKVEAGMERLRQSPAALAEWNRMAVASRKPLNAFFLFLCGSGEWQDLVFFKQRNILSSFYKPDAATRLKQKLLVADHWQSYPKIKPLALKTWQELAPAIAEFRKSHDLGDGDGHSKETAFALPEGMSIRDSSQFLDDFARAVAGDKAVAPNFGYTIDVDKNGRLCTYVSIFMGRASGSFLQGGSNLLLPIYFHERAKQ